MTMRLPDLQARSVPSASRQPRAARTEFNFDHRDLHLYDNHNLTQIGNRHGRPDCSTRHHRPPRGFLHRPADRGAGRACRHRHARNQYPAAFAAADGRVAEGIERGGHFSHHHFPCSVRSGPTRGRTDLGSLRTPLAGLDRLCCFLRWQHLARAMALIMIAMAAAPGFSPLLGGALDHYFGWRSEFALVAVFAGLGALAYGTVFGETHHATRTPLDPLAIAKTYLGLIADRRFVMPAATVSLIMGGLFSVFSAAPRVLIEAMHFTPIQLGWFFA